MNADLPEPRTGSNRLLQVADLFADALEHSTEDREGFLRRACGDDQGLHAEVLTLLGALPAGEAMFEDSELEARKAAEAADPPVNEPVR